MEMDEKITDLGRKALADALGPYDLNPADLTAAAKAAFKAFAMACSPPLRLAWVEPDGVLRLEIDPGLTEALRLFLFKQVLVERQWLADRYEELPEGWALCMHRFPRLGNELGELTMTAELSVHQLPPGYVCGIQGPDRELIRKPETHAGAPID